MTKIPVPKGLIVTRSYRSKVKSKKSKPSAATIRARKSRRKGHGFEREIAIKFRSIGYDRACRLLEYQEGKGIDLSNTGIYDVQCKRTKKYTSLTAINEIPVAEGRVPLLVAKADYGDTLVAMPLDHFLELIKPKT